MKRPSNSNSSTTTTSATTAALVRPLSEQQQQQNSSTAANSSSDNNNSSNSGSNRESLQSSSNKRSRHFRQRPRPTNKETEPPSSFTLSLVAHFKKMCSRPSFARRKSFASNNKCSTCAYCLSTMTSMRNLLWLMICVTISSSGFFVVKYHAKLTSTTTGTTLTTSTANLMTLDPTILPSNSHGSAHGLGTSPLVRGGGGGQRTNTTRNVNRNMGGAAAVVFDKNRQERRARSTPPKMIQQAARNLGIQARVSYQVFGESSNWLQQQDHHYNKNKTTNATTTNVKSKNDKTSSTAPDTPSRYCGRHAQVAALESAAPLDKNARVVITGIVSHAMGVPLALRLHSTCRVQKIIGFDALLPNRKLERMPVLHEKYALLQQRLLQQQDGSRSTTAFPRLIVPQVGMDLTQALHAHDVTHVVHLVDPQRPLLESLYNLQQVVTSVLQYSPQKQQQAVQLVYVTTPTVATTSGSSSAVMHDDKQRRTPTTNLALQTIATALLRQHQSNKANADTTASAAGSRTRTPIGLTLPHLVTGEYDVQSSLSRKVMKYLDAGTDKSKNGTTAMTTTNDSTNRIADNDDKESTTSPKDRDSSNHGKSDDDDDVPYLLVDDAVDVVVSALQFAPPPSSSSGNFVTFQVPSDTTMSMLSKRVDDLLSDDRENKTKTTTDQRNHAAVSTAAATKKQGKQHQKHERFRLRRRRLYDAKNATRLLQNDLHYWLGWTPTSTVQDGVSKILSMHLAHKYPYGDIPSKYEDKYNRLLAPRNNDKDDDAVGESPLAPQRTLFPCASECARHFQDKPLSCLPTMMDATAKLSKKVTRGCKYIVYTVDLWPNVHDLPSSGEPWDDEEDDSTWCKIAFVSSNSRLVHKIVNTTRTSRNITTVAASSAASKDATATTALNGKVQYKNWTLVWVNGDATSMSEAEYTVLKLTPKRFFANSVRRAMYVQPNRFPVPSFESVHGYFKMLDPLARNERRYKEYRSGVNIFRFRTKPTQKARRVVLSTLEASFHDIPPRSPVTKYVEQIVEREGIRPNRPKLALQLAYYTYAAHLIQTCPRRPEHEIRSTIYTEFPFHWLKTVMLVHDLREDESRNLRCEWYDEHLFWGNSHLEDVSLAYVLAKRRIMGRHAVEDEKEAGWTAIMDTPARTEEEEPERLVNDEDMELYLRILPKPKRPSSSGAGGSG